METQRQNSIRYSVVSTTIEISKHIEIGKLIGRKGRNLKPIAEKTSTHIHVIDNTNPAQIEIKIIKDRVGNSSPRKRIDEAKFQIDKLLEDIETRNRRKDIEKEEEKVRFSDNGNRQHATVATPRNHKDTDLKEERKRFKRKTPYKKRQSRNKENSRSNAPVNHMHYN
ncbi:unnamed protein product [Rhizophagus irregularis]|uniref:K Homology domain-containing protein n=1 Tax=Rhizophagus irregularis TaxID=588596 RepID=A0A2N1MIA5_9GLOM|nr:hypothetical protein RhiirC2_816862 [Rhizophagus irregularis]CAB4390023.1 unnamed protein product [Rhizophagus irregularis]CAB5370268.1 unnamed protein product [Rhizophagus irregularis]